MSAISPREYQLIRDILQRILPRSETILFGSRLRGDHSTYSDLDLAIKAPEPLALHIMAELKEALSASDLAYTVDVVDYNRVSDNFKKVIDQGRTF